MLFTERDFPEGSVRGKHLIPNIQNSSPVGWAGGAR